MIDIKFIWWRWKFNRAMAALNSPLLPFKFSECVDQETVRLMYTQKTSPEAALYSLWISKFDAEAASVDPGLHFFASEKMRPHDLLAVYQENPSDLEEAVLYAMQCGMCSFLAGSQQWHSRAAPVFTLPRSSNEPNLRDQAHAQITKLIDGAQTVMKLRQQSVANERRMMGDKVLEVGQRVSVLPLRGDWGVIVGVSKGYQEQPYYEIAMDNKTTEAASAFCYARQLQWAGEDAA